MKQPLSSRLASSALKRPTLSLRLTVGQRLVRFCGAVPSVTCVASVPTDAHAFQPTGQIGRETTQGQGGDIAATIDVVYGLPSIPILRGTVNTATCDKGEKEDLSEDSTLGHSLHALLH